MINFFKFNFATSRKIYEAQPRIESEPVPDESEAIVDQVGASGNKKALHRRKTDNFAHQSTQVVLLL